jgi:hypothetical protein
MVCFFRNFIGPIIGGGQDIFPLLQWLPEVDVTYHKSIKLGTGYGSIENYLGIFSRAVISKDGKG